MTAGLSEDKLDELITIQRETLRWIRFTSIPQLKHTLEAVLASELDKQVFEMSNGEATTRSIGATLGVSKTTVLTKWGKWAQIGIVEKLPSGQCRRLCSLAEVGIEVPEAKPAAPEPVEAPEGVP